MNVGVRVVRGPDWKWHDQDDGEGHVGTVVEIGKPGSKSTPDKTVVVQWDCGARTNYRVGCQDAYDLCVLDNAQAGVKHPNIICDSCRRQGIAGIRWKCSKCYDFDLCTTCFMADKHDLNHPFVRYETAYAQGKEMPKRFNEQKVESKGLFVKAKVTRGPDWDWGNQDGGDGKIGEITQIRGWVNESDRSVANVMWPSGFSNVYRCGHKGRVDLKYVEHASGGYYYKNFLPVLGQLIEMPAVQVNPASSHESFNVGDRVKVMHRVETLKQMQEGHGGWNPRMAEYIGLVGKVHRVTDKGDIRVQYEGCKNRWTFHPGALTKVTSFAVGDFVTVITDESKVKIYQEGHGEWIDIMKETLGKVGKIIKIYSDGDLRVHVENRTWTFNPLCLISLPNTSTELNNSMRSHTREDHHGSSLASVIGQLMEQRLEPTSADELVREAAQGHLDVVRELVDKHPDKINLKSSSKTALQVACHQGHKSVVEFLLAENANLEVQDDDGDTCLHYSAFGNQAEIMELLLIKGANQNALNNGKCSALHVAVNKQYMNCVNILLRFNCDLNIQDSYGDTALHDAIGKENAEMVELLVNRPDVDLMLQNNRGFNVLHHAALKGNIFATEKIVARSRQIIDIKKDDGFAALHLAALNGHLDVAEILIDQGLCDIDVKNNRQQTPLLLAVSQAHCHVAELLVVKGSNLNAKDEDGDTALHLALMRLTSNESASRIVANDQDTSANIGTQTKQIMEQLEGDTVTKNPILALACFLVQNKCDTTLKNCKGKKALDIISDNNICSLINKYSTKPSTHPKSANRSGEETVLYKAVPGTSFQSDAVGECLICSDATPNVFFEPCGHRITCQVCCLRMKKCVLCQNIIIKKIGPGGRLISTKRRDQSAERVTFLENKIQEIQEAHTCSICMERNRNIAFLCGHSACIVCAQTLKTCHMCRKPITKKINLYV